MIRYNIMRPPQRGQFGDRLLELEKILRNWLMGENTRGRKLRHLKVFLSDIQNQYGLLIQSGLYKNFISQVSHSIIEQPPLDGSKINLLAMTSDEKPSFMFHALRLESKDTAKSNAYEQTLALFNQYIAMLATKKMNIATHLARTWIYVADIDVNYYGVVKARNEIFEKHGLTVGTHFIASTGIGGASQSSHAKVAIDFLSYPNIKETDKKYLTAPEFLNPTHEYGVAFERGTRVSLPSRDMFYISGTASINNRGEVVHVGDVEKQTKRLLKNIEALLADGGAEMKDISYFVVYLRDLSDYAVVERYMRHAYPATPCIITQAKVCRPEWLIEMECAGSRARV